MTSSAYSLAPTCRMIHQDEDDNSLMKQRRAVLEYCTTSIAPEARVAYTEALLKAPHLFDNEADPLKFLRCEDNDIQRAGQRLIEYWSRRRELFGDDRYLLPLDDFTGKGALDEGTISALKVGFLQFLPNDVKGRTVLYMDQPRSTTEKLEGHATRPVRKRALFYMLHRASELGQPIVLLRYSDLPHIDKVKIQAFQESVLKSPIKLEAFLLVYRPPPGSRRLFTETLIPLVQQYIHKLLQTIKEHKCILGSSEKDFLQGLEPCGFRKDGLPPHLGGTFHSDDSLEVFLRLNEPRPPSIDKEPAKELSSSVNTVLSNEPASLKRPAIALKEPPSSIHPTSAAADEKMGIARMPQESLTSVASTMSESSESPSHPHHHEHDHRSPILEERRNRKRQKDLAYSRERRRLEKEEIDQLQLQVSQLYNVNESLRDEEARLVNLLVQAQSEVYAAHGYPVPPLPIPAAATVTTVPPFAPAASAVVAPIATNTIPSSLFAGGGLQQDRSRYLFASSGAHPTLPNTATGSALTGAASLPSDATMGMDRLHNAVAAARLQGASMNGLPPALLQQDPSMLSLLQQQLGRAAVRPEALTLPELAHLVRRQQAREAVLDRMGPLPQESRVQYLVQALLEQQERESNQQLLEELLARSSTASATDLAGGPGNVGQTPRREALSDEERLLRLLERRIASSQAARAHLATPPSLTDAQRHELLQLLRARQLQEQREALLGSGLSSSVAVSSATRNDATWENLLGNRRHL